MLAACSSSATTMDSGVHDAGHDAGATDSGSGSDAATADAGPQESHGSCTGEQEPSNVIRCFQFPASISEAAIRAQCETAGETFAVTCSTENLFGACEYENQTWYFYEPATEEQRTQASSSCGGGTWVEY